MKRTTIIGAATIACGIAVVLMAAHLLPAPSAHRHAPPWLVAVLGMLFVMLGIVFAAGDRLPRSVVALLNCVDLTLFGLVTGWIAFGPGTRQLGTTLGVPYMMVRGAGSAIVGRWLFALATGTLVILAVLAWAYWVRKMLGAPGALRGVR